MAKRAMHSFRLARDENDHRAGSPRGLSVPERHQLRIARDTLRMSDIGASLMGGPSKAEAREIIMRLTGRRPVE